MGGFQDFKRFLKELPKDHCFLVELDWLTIFDSKTIPLEEVFAALSKAKCQVIATMMDNGRKIPPFKGARILKLPYRLM
jgi:predicted RNase H-like HicB family nuclease